MRVGYSCVRTACSAGLMPTSVVAELSPRVATTYGSLPPVICTAKEPGIAPDTADV